MQIYDPEHITFDTLLWSEFWGFHIGAAVDFILLEYNTG